MKNKKLESLIDNAFSNENGNIKGLPVYFYYAKVLYKHYQYKIVDNEPYLIVSTPYKVVNGEIQELKTPKNLFEFNGIGTNMPCKNANLLISLLKLAYKLEEKYNYDYKIKECRNEIIKWCKIYGFPFMGKQYGLLNDDTKHNWELFNNHCLIGFSIPGFILQLRTLYLSFIDYLIYKSNGEIISYTNVTVEECKDMLKSLFSELRTYLHFDFNTLQISTEFYNLFSAAVYELMLLASTVKNNDMKDLSICECCGTPYERTQRNQKYCPECSPQKAYKRRKSKIESIRKAGE